MVRTRAESTKEIVRRPRETINLVQSGLGRKAVRHLRILQPTLNHQHAVVIVKVVLQASSNNNNVVKEEATVEGVLSVECSCPRTC